VLAKLRRDVPKEGIAIGLRYGFGSLHQPVEIVSGQSQSQLVQGGPQKTMNAATGLWFRLQSSPFSRMSLPESAEPAGAPFNNAEREHVFRVLQVSRCQCGVLVLSVRALRCGN
jgi:hypothetical protein